jgi:hypothetical protein
MINLPSRTICDMNCFLPPGHEGPHQIEPPMRICPCCRGTGQVVKWEQRLDPDRSLQ